MDDLHARKPINKTAALVVSKGFHWEKNEKINKGESFTYIKTRPLTKIEINNYNCEDLTGIFFGRFTVIGRSKYSKGWVVRCSCGVYCIRHKKSILNINNKYDACSICRHKAYLKRNAIWRTTGVEIDHIDNY